MTVQRRQGLPVTLRPTKVVEDDRGNPQLIPDPDVAYEMLVWEYPQRGGISELPGDQQIRTTRIGYSLTDSNGDPVENFGIKARVTFPTGSPLEGEWDVVTPPAFHYGTRHTRHWSCDIRMRP